MAPKIKKTFVPIFVMNELYHLLPDQFVVSPELMESITNVKTKPIFNPDGKRSQGIFRDPILDAVVLANCEKFGLPKKLSCVVIRSEAGCVRQPIHTDYDPKQPSSRNKAGVICSLMPNTKINISEKETINLPVGSLFFFRGDAPHGGSAYEQANWRVHFYVGTAPKNKTFLIEKHMLVTPQYTHNLRKRLRYKHNS
jgi:hypothetical protein